MVGRHSCSIAITLPNVSAKHIEILIQRAPPQFTIHVFNENTYLDGTRLAIGGPYVVEKTTDLWIGDAVFKIMVRDPGYIS